MKSQELSKTQIQERIKEVFSKESPTKEEIRKIRKLAMSKNIKLKDQKKKFCKKCNSYFNGENSEIRIKNNNKVIRCKACNHLSRYKMK